MGVARQYKVELPDVHRRLFLTRARSLCGAAATLRGAGGGRGLPHQAATGPGDADRAGGRGLAAGALGGLRRGLRPLGRLPGRGGRAGAGLPGVRYRPWAHRHRTGTRSPSRFLWGISGQDHGPPRDRRTLGHRDLFREGKQLLGLGDYEGRSWQGWHRHMTLCLLCLLYSHCSRGRRLLVYRLLAKLRDVGNRAYGS